MNTTTTTNPATEHDAQQATTVLQRQRLLEAQATRIAVLQEEIRQREDEVATLKNTILDQWPEGTYEAGHLKVSIRPGAKTISAPRFAKAFPPADYPDLYKRSPDSTKARRQLGEERLAAVMTSRKPTVVVA
jgi:hypothetical protein